MVFRDFSGLWAMGLTGRGPVKVSRYSWKVLACLLCPLGRRASADFVLSTRRGILKPRVWPQKTTDLTPRVAPGLNPDLRNLCPRSPKTTGLAPKNHKFDTEGCTRFGPGFQKLMLSIIGAFQDMLT